MSRPSAHARKAAGSVSLLVLASVEFIVSLYQYGLIFKHEPFYLAQIVRANPAIPGEHNRLQPKLTLTIGISHMNMSRLVPFVGEKMEPITPDPQNCRH